MTKFEIRTIKTDEDHAWAIAQIEAFCGSQEGTPEFEYLMVLSELVSNYEHETILSDFPDREPQPPYEVRESFSPASDLDMDKLFGPVIDPSRR